MKETKMAKTKRRGFFRGLAVGATATAASVVAGDAKAAPPPKYPEGTTGWAREMIVAGHRVRQRCWKDGAGCEMPEQIMELFGHHYDEGIDTFAHLPVFSDMLWGNDWEIVS